MIWISTLNKVTNEMLINEWNEPNTGHASILEKHKKGTDS